MIDYDTDMMHHFLHMYIKLDAQTVITTHTQGHMYVCDSAPNLWHSCNTAG